VYVLHLRLAKRAIIERLAKNLFWKNAYWLVMYTSALLLLHNIAFVLFWGTKHQCILMRLTELKPIKQDLKKYCMHPHVVTFDNIGIPVLYCAAHRCERLTAQLLLTLRGT
jgi:hypothetical protein